MNLFRRTHLPSPQYSDDLHDPDELPGMPPRPAGCQPAASAPRWHGAGDSKGAVNPSYDPCGPPSRTPETRRNA